MVGALRFLLYATESKTFYHSINDQLSNWHTTSTVPQDSNILPHKIEVCLFTNKILDVKQPALVQLLLPGTNYILRLTDYAIGALH